MLHSMTTARDDRKPETRSKLHLVTADKGPGEEKQHGASSLAEGITPGNSMEESLQGLVENARAGDQEAFRAIFQRYGRPVMAFICHILGDRSRAEELTQETFFRAFRGLVRLQEGIKLSTWLFGIARNVAREAIRDRRRSRGEIGLDDFPSLAMHDERAGPDEIFMSVELQRAIRSSLGDLTEDQRIVFALKLLHKMRYEEIAQITGSSIGKLKTDLHRARQHMRQELRSYVEGREPRM
jgi:RNA polymerase sigma-70 factor (ECF subfamily)